MNVRSFRADGGRFAAVVAFLIASAFGFSVYAAEEAEIRIISTNDLHSYLRPVYYRYLDEMKPAHGETRCIPGRRRGRYLARRRHLGFR
jgi:hypothetical protein